MSRLLKLLPYVVYFVGFMVVAHQTDVWLAVGVWLMIMGLIFADKVSDL